VSRVVAPVDHRDVGAALRRLALPAGLALSADQLLGIVDTIVIGTFGAAALAGITAAVSVFVTVLIPLFAFYAGTRIMGAQAIGAGDLERFGRIVRASAVVPLAISLVASAVSVVAARPVITAMLGDDAIAGPASAYLALRCCSLIAIVVSEVAITAFAAAGDTRLALRVLIVINLVHVPLLVLLALGPLTHHPLGLVGAGISSLVSEVVGALYCAREMVRRRDLHIFASRGVDLRLARAAAVLGWPEFVFLALVIVPEPLTVTFLAPLGVTTVAAFRALSIVSNVSWAFPGSLGQAAQIVIGQRLGARDLAGARAFARDSIGYATAVCAVVAAVVALLARPLAELFTLSATLATLAAGPLAAHMASLPLKGFSMTALAPIRAAGDTRFSMWMGVLSGGCSVAGLWIGITLLHWGLWAVPVAWFVAWSMRSALTWLRYRDGDWERRVLAV
jgi:putative MATE family efflux protein